MLIDKIIQFHLLGYENFLCKSSHQLFGHSALEISAIKN